MWTQELQERVSREWTTLLADVEAAVGEDPASARAQALASAGERWSRASRGDPEVRRA
jgi:hypothetical protein